MVRKKYDVIDDMLRREQMHYTKQQNELEDVLKQQKKELGIYLSDAFLSDFNALF